MDDASDYLDTPLCPRGCLNRMDPLDGAHDVVWFCPSCGATRD